MRTGRQIVVREQSDTPLEAVARLEVEEQPPPDPTTLGPRDVVVRVRSASVGWVDLLMTAGRYQHAPHPPYRPGMEWAGEVAWVGREVTSLAVGDPVIADGLRTGPRSSGPHQAEGGFGTWSVATEDALIPLPIQLSLHQGACLLGSYETATHVLVTCGEVKPGEKVLILGASGATGLAAVHVAKLLGATVIAAGRSPEKLEIVRKEGADEVLCTTTDDLREGARGCDVVYDPVGGELTVRAMRALRFGGRLLVVGWASTPDVARTGANQLPTNLIMMKGLTVRGCPAVISTQRDPAIRPPRLRRILDWVAEGRLQPRVAEVRDLSEIREAMLAKWESRTVGSVVVTP